MVDTMDVQQMSRDFHEKLYIKTRDNTELDIFLHTYNLPRMDHYETANPNEPIISGMPESMMEVCYQRKAQNLMTHW